MKRLLPGTAVALAVLATPEPAQAFSIINNTDPKSVSLDDVVTVLSRLIRYLWAFAGGIAIIFIVVAGYQYILSAGNPEKIEKAKMGLTWSIGGFILAISSFAIVYLVQLTLQSKTTVRGKLQPDGTAPYHAANIIERLAELLFTLAGAAAVLFLILGGYRYMTSRGNQEQVEKAKITVLYSVIGLIVIFSSVVAFRLVQQAVGVK